MTTSNLNIVGKSFIAITKAVTRNYIDKVVCQISYQVCCSENSEIYNNT